MINGISHVAIAVPDLESAIAQFRRIYGLEPGETHVNAEQKVRLVYFESGNCRIELISPLDSSSPVSAFLRKHPAGGLHHICFGTSDLKASINAVVQAGGAVLGENGARENYAGTPIAFIHPNTTCGVLVELEEEVLLESRK